MKGRENSLDVLREPDLFILVALQPVLMQTAYTLEDGSMTKEILLTLFTHVACAWYHIGWIYSSMNFVTTVMSGVLAGWFLKCGKKHLRKERTLFGDGATWL